jgi:release factor glutamine methyltransferase
MSQANLFAYLVGILAVESQRRAQSSGRAHPLARELWHAVAGTVWSPQPKVNVLLPELDTLGVERLCTLVGTQVSAAAAAMLAAYCQDYPVTIGATGAPVSAGQGLPATQEPLYRELLVETTTRLQVLNDKPEETVESTLRALWHTAAGAPMSAERASAIALPALDSAAVARLRELLAQRFTGVPLAHLTGRQRFMDMELEVGKAALVPRKETELLGSAALAVLRQMAATQATLRVIDVCTGAGNLAFALATHEPKAQVYASDLSTEAVELARHNGVQLGLGQRVEFRQGDFLAPFAGGDFDRNVDLLVGNPPYISSGKVVNLPAEIIGHEPSLAFDGGPFGVKILQRMIAEAPQFLRSGGWLAFEVGLGQGPAIMDRLGRNPAYADLSAVEDATGAIRAVLVRV